MTHRSEDGRAALVRLPRGSDMLQALNQAAADLGISAGTVQAIGAVSSLVVGFYRQDAKEYVTHTFPGPHEIASGLGNVSIRDGRPFVHFHVAATGPDGRAVGGHLMEGTTVFLIEAYFRDLGGPAPVREFEEDLGLFVWRR